VPKRHAKRAVTRTLVKRQIRNAAADCADRLPDGLWVVRQRAPFDPKQFPSAASDAFKEAARTELRALFERAVRGERDRLKPRTAAPKTGMPAAGSTDASAVVKSDAPTAPQGDACTR
jgi:ribonuclease P protein component